MYLDNVMVAAALCHTFRITQRILALRNDLVDCCTEYVHNSAELQMLCGCSHCAQGCPYSLT